MPIVGCANWGRRCSITNRLYCSIAATAHEHLGELYLALGEPAKAEGQLATLEDICLIPCVETDDLKRVIAAYKTLVMR